MFNIKFVSRFFFHFIVSDQSLQNCNLIHLLNLCYGFTSLQFNWLTWTGGPAVPDFLPPWVYCLNLMLYLNRCFSEVILTIVIAVALIIFYHLIYHIDIFGAGMGAVSDHWQHIVNNISIA